MFKRFQQRHLLAALLGLLLTVTISTIASAATPPTPRQPPATPTSEIRGVWLTNVDSEVLFSRAAVTEALDRLVQLNFNTVYPTVWNDGYTLYPSAVAQKEIGVAVDPTPGLKGRDVLQEIVEQAHQRGLTVIPWFEFGFMLPANSELVQRHPDWITRRLDGSTIWKEGIHERVWLNPFHPQVQQFILDLILELVTQYNLDGIQLDDHFGLPAEFGYDPITTRLYRVENPTSYLVQVLQGSPPKKPEAWVNWRADKITKFMERVFREIKVRKRNCIVSVSPNPQEFSKNKFLLDWQTWEKRGLIEELFVQVYRTDMNRFIKEIEQPEVEAARRHIPVGIGILSGLKNQPTPLRQIESQVAEVRKRQFQGVSFFFYESLWRWATESPPQRHQGFQRLFPVKVPRPIL